MEKRAGDLPHTGSWGVGGPGRPGVTSAPVANLVQGLLKSMSYAKALFAPVLLLALGLLGAGLALFASTSPAPEGPPPQARRPAEKAPPEPRPPAEKRTRLDFHGDPLPPQAVSRLGSLRLRHRAGVRSLAVSADGKLLASGSSDGTTRLWDAATGRELRRFPGDNIAGDMVALSPDGKFLAAGRSGKVVSLWDLSTGKERARLPHPKGVFSLAFSPDGKWLAVGTDDTPGLRLWEAGTGRLLWQFGDREDGRSVSFSPDGRVLASHGTLWDLPTKHHPALKRPTRRDRPVPWARSTWLFAPSGKALASRGHQYIRYQELEILGNKYRILPAYHEFRAPRGAVFYAAAVSPDSKALASGDSDGEVRLWDLRTGKEVRRFQGSLRSVRTLAFSPDGKTLFSAGDGQIIRCWEVATGRERLPCAGHRDRVSHVALAADGRTLATAGSDGTVRLWDDAGKELRVLRGHRRVVCGVAFSPDGKAVASASLDRTVRLWDVASGKQRHRLEGHEHLASAVAFAPDGKTLASAGLLTVRQWDAVTGKELPRLDSQLADPQVVTWVRARELLRLDGRRGSAQSLVFAPDGKIRRLKGAGKNRPLAWSPSGKTIAEGGQDRQIHIWEVATDQQVHRFGKHEAALLTLAFSPDGRAVASTSVEPRPGWGPTGGKIDPTIHVWDVATGKRLLRLAGHEEVVGAVAFSQDGRRLASASADGTVLVWDVSALGGEARN
jgi:WD40 repeat protein